MAELTAMEKMEKLQQNYASAMEVAKYFDSNNTTARLLRDRNKASNKSITSYTRETLRTFLKAPGNNEINLRNASRYLYYRSQIYFRLVNWYASMWDLRCRKVIPQYDLTKDNDGTKMLKSYNDTLDLLQTYNIQENWYDVVVKCYTEDVCYSIFYRDETGSFFYILDPDECRIDGKYMTGDFSFAINMSKWRNAQKQQLIEWLGEPFTSMWGEYESSGENFIHVPDEYAACFKFRSETWDVIIPPFVSIFQDLVGLNDLADIQAVADQQSIYKLLVLPMKILSGAKQSDDWEISPEILKEYFNIMLDNAIPDYVSAAMVPGEGLDVISFADSAADKDIDRIQNTQDNILSTAGGGAVLNARNINSTAAFKAWLRAETEFAISSLLPQIQGFTNRMLSHDTGNPCKVEYFEVSVYTKEELAEQLLSSNQYGYNNKIFYNTLLGISEKATIAMNFLEESVLELHNKMIYPLQSSYTTSNNGEVGQGRDTLPDDEIEPSTERSRNA